MKENLLDRIDEVRINSVSDEDYEVFMGECIHKHLDVLMGFAEDFDSKIKSSF